jgi:NAD(P)-dependent dehydrogenase (short-subunit alcohol dehydrogenase family)
MVDRGFGAIVNIVHIYSFERGAQDFVHSGAARAGVVSMTRTLAFHWARRGVTVNALAPGSIATEGLREEEFASADVDDYESVAVRDIPSHRLGEPEEVAGRTLHQRRLAHRRRRLLPRHLDAAARPGRVTRHAGRSPARMTRCISRRSPG